MFKKYKEQIKVMEMEIDSLKEDNNNLNSIIASLNEQIKTKDDEIKELHYNYDDIIKSKKLEINKLDEQLHSYESNVDIQRLGFYDIKEPLYYKDELVSVREKQRQMLINKSYYNVSEKWFINGDSKQGDSLIRFLTHIAITSFNLLCDNCMDKVNVSNNRALKSKIKRTFENYNNELSRNSVQLNKTYLNLKLDELNINYKIKLAKDKEKEEHLLQKEILKEQARVEKEIEQNKLKLEKKMLYLLAQKDKGIDVDEDIKEIQKQLDDDEYMLTNKRAGYVYIISNPSLGKDVYKIGLTRRSEYEIRIKELSGSNVPFAFRPNCIMWSDDCFKLESDLHHEFDKYRVNKIKTHREFFKLPLSQIEKVVKGKYCHNAMFEHGVIDEDFIASGYKISENFLDNQQN